MPYKGVISLPLMLTTARCCGGDRYESFYKIPVGHAHYSTERKVVRRGQGALLKTFLKGPVHVSRRDGAHAATRTLPDSIYPRNRMAAPARHSARALSGEVLVRRAAGDL